MRSLILPLGRRRKEVLPHSLVPGVALAGQGKSFKNRMVLGPRPWDNSSHEFGYQLDNRIPIETWFDISSDCGLLQIQLFFAAWPLSEPFLIRRWHRRQLYRCKFQAGAAAGPGRARVLVVVNSGSAGALLVPLTMIILLASTTWSDRLAAACVLWLLLTAC